MFICSRQKALLFHFARCPALLKITLGQATQRHVYVIGLFHLHTCKLIKSLSLCTQQTYRLPLVYYYCHRLCILQTSLHITVVPSLDTTPVESGLCTNFSKTIRTNKIEQRAIMLFICTTKNDRWVTSVLKQIW